MLEQKEMIFRSCLLVVIEKIAVLKKMFFRTQDKKIAERFLFTCLAQMI